MPNRPNFPIPENIHAELMCLQLMIPNDPTWKSVVAGLLYELQYWFNWQRDEGESGKECAAVWKEIYKSIDWSTMSCCCEDQIPVQYRYIDDGILQRSTDGGETWTNAPEYDPRNNSTQFPPISGSDGDDKKCVAATGAVALIKEQVGDQLTDDMTRYTLSQLITDWVGTMIDSSNPFEALLTVITNQIFALVIATLRPALTDTVYDTLICILYCRMENNASFTQIGWGKVRTDITEQIGGIAGIFLEHLIFLLGSVGLTNLARSSGASVGDCSDCPECGEGCHMDLWTFANATEISRTEDTITVEMTNAGAGHMSVSTNNCAVGCYIDWSPKPAFYSTWQIGSCVSPDNLDTKSHLTWNLDLPYSNGDIITFHFSKTPIG